jgi:hypothetical protein
MLEVLNVTRRRRPQWNATASRIPGQQYVGIDLHRRRGVIVRTTDAGELLEAVQIANSPLALADEAEDADGTLQVGAAARPVRESDPDDVSASGVRAGRRHGDAEQSWLRRRVRDRGVAPGSVEL